MPEAAELLEPLVGSREWAGFDGIDAPRPLGAGDREAGLAKHAEMLRDGGLGDPELALHDRAEFSGAVLAVREQFEQAPSHGVTQNVQRVHGLILASELI